MKSKWYENKIGVIMLLIFVFPVGLYALWKNTGFKTATKITLSVVLAFFLIAISAPPPPDSISTKKTTEDVSKKWYEGGTLHQSNALAWQKADANDKLATASDFFSMLWKNKQFNPAIQTSIQSVDDIKPYAEELVKFLDGATKPEPDPKTNEQMYFNQKISDMAVIGFMSMGWTK
jgi:hypothetical protein